MTGTNLHCPLQTTMAPLERGHAVTLEPVRCHPDEQGNSTTPFSHMGPRTATPEVCP